MNIPATVPVPRPLRRQPSPRRFAWQVPLWIVAVLLGLLGGGQAQAGDRMPPSAPPTVRLTTSGWVLRSGDPLEAQVRQVVEGRGYHLVWKLDRDQPAGVSAGTYTSWQQLVVDATQDIARLKTGPAVASPLVCPASRRIIVALESEARRLAQKDPGHDCVPLRADPVSNAVGARP